VGEAFGDLDTALASGPDAAVIATPAPLHVSLATRLAEAGVHVLIEKPLSTNLEGIDRLRHVVRERGGTAAGGYVYRCHPSWAALRGGVGGGRFGGPVELVAVCGQHFPTYRPAYRDIYYRDRATGGGAIQDALTHIVNAGEWLLGPVDRLVADAAHLVLDGVAVGDTVHLLARHGPPLLTPSPHVGGEGQKRGSALASYSLNQHQAFNEMTLTVIGERGTARCEFHEHRWRWLVEPGGTWHDEPIPPLERDALFITQANA